MLIEEQFEKIAERADSKACNVQCSVEQYIEGLDIIIQRLQDSRQAAEDGLGHD